MDAKQVLIKGDQDIKQIKSEVTVLKGKNTRQSNLIKELTDALEALKKQYEDMLRASDATIAAQADRIKKLGDKNRELRRQLEELKKNAA
ncbi:hypothetical protein NDA07_10980 [Microcoleus vaginatus DQ-U2]|uniref:hypothetical protein n=1 Tax=Microcoleus vaginatus TaxID=119532 RepID=UPI001684BC66|nr:hypothetical protein [Microcoleus sp. FACHB-DQ6]